MKQIQKELDSIVSIIKCVNPEKIYLFGSVADDNNEEDIDIDLIIVAPSTDRPLERRLKLRRMLRDFDKRIGLDLLVYTPEEFEMLAAQRSSFVYSAIKKGKAIYERKAS